MLGKILKYEFKATSRVIVLMYAVLLVISTLMAVFGWLDIGGSLGADNSLAANIIDAAASFSTLFYVLAVIGVGVLPIVVIVVRFYRMMGDEGYLWFTLPATSDQHILGKLIVAVVWEILSIILICVSIFVCLIGYGSLSFLPDLADFWGELVSLGFNPLLWSILGVVCLLTAIISGTLTFYAACAIGPNLTKSRLGGSVLAYLLIYIVMQIIGTIQTFLLFLPVARIADGMTVAIPRGGEMAESEAIGALMSAVSSASIDQIALLMLGGTTLVYVAYSVVLYLITRYFISKKLNLA